VRAPPGYDVKQAIKEHQQSSAINRPLIRALIQNQILILSLATVVCGIVLISTQGFDALSHLSEIAHWDGGAIVPPGYPPIVVGIAGAMPLLAISSWVENSDSRSFANINFSTIVMAMTLFGRRKAPPNEFLPDNLKGKNIPTTKVIDAAYQSFVLSLVTGICEETVFRLQVAALFSVLSGGNVEISLLGQAALFGLGHSQTGTPFTENAIVVGLQCVNGIGFGLIYLTAGGDIISCIVAHAVYDFVTFFKTWMDANAQVEYAESMYLEPLPQNIESEVRQVLRSSARSVPIDPQQLKRIKRLFYTFDFDKNKTLSLSEVRKGIAYLALERAGQPPPQEVVDKMFRETINSRDPSIVSRKDKDRLFFSDFIRLYCSFGPRPALKG